ncbi:thermonuclease family protein [Demequina gelatinilytica]|uniref:thermonuclease family protein n=1 Tax=Demequina gelatinilytica TaxID=1638980 RepID=UPI00078505CD|nr:hypothetical protein [Demequina gelatinilytica]
MKTFAWIIALACIALGLTSLRDADGGSAAAPSSAAPSATAAQPDERVFETGVPAELTAEARTEMREWAEWLDSAEDLAIPTEYVEGGGDAVVAQFEALAASYPGSQANATALAAAADDLAPAYRALDRGAPAEARAARWFEAAATDLDGLGARIVEDFERAERESGYRLSGQAFDTDAAWTNSATVERWLDADTVETSLGTVRLIGIDTPTLGEGCSTADDALAAVEQIAPAGTIVTLVNPQAVEDTDKYGRLLRYIDLADGTDVGYSLLLNGVAEARFDSRDGFVWHPREKAYRDGAVQVADAGCAWVSEFASGFAPAEGEDVENRAARLASVELALDGAGTRFEILLESAQAAHAAAEKAEKAEKAAAQAD